MSLEALDLMRERIATHGIDCDWRDGYLGLATSARKARELRGWADAHGAVYGYPLQRIAPADMPRWIASPRYHGGVHDPRSGHLHPLKYTLGLARAAAAPGVRIHETVAGAPRWSAAPQPLLRTAAGQRARPPGAAGRQRLPAGHWRRSCSRASCRSAPTSSCTEPLGRRWPQR